MQEGRRHMAYGRRKMRESIKRADRGQKDILSSILYLMPHAFSLPYIFSSGHPCLYFLRIN
jgi:hypothetical protein